MPNLPTAFTPVPSLHFQQNDKEKYAKVYEKG